MNPRNTVRNKLIIKFRKKGMWLKDIAKNPEVTALSKNKISGISVNTVWKVIHRDSGGKLTKRYHTIRHV